MNSGPDRVADAHVHLWNRTRLDYDWLSNESGVLQNNFLSPELDAAFDLGDVVIGGAVAVQADCRDEQSFLEVQWFESLADEGAPITAIVANAPLEHGEDCLAEVTELASTYSAWYETVTTILGDLPEVEQNAILGPNALAVYDPAQRSARVKESINGAH